MSETQSAAQQPHTAAELWQKIKSYTKSLEDGGAIIDGKHTQDSLLFGCTCSLQKTLASLCIALLLESSKIDGFALS